MKKNLESPHTPHIFTMFFMAYTALITTSVVLGRFFCLLEK